jgi:hypothetical protein
VTFWFFSFLQDEKGAVPYNSRSFIYFGKKITSSSSSRLALPALNTTITAAKQN